MLLSRQTWDVSRWKFFPSLLTPLPCIEACALATVLTNRRALLPTYLCAFPSRHPTALALEAHGDSSFPLSFCFSLPWVQCNAISHIHNPSRGCCCCRVRYYFVSFPFPLAVCSRLMSVCEIVLPWFVRWFPVIH